MLTQGLFWVLAVVAVGSALLMITRRNAVYSALFLVMCFFSVAGLYVLLNAQFIAAVQVIVYTGAIMVLFLLTIMLLGPGHAPGEEYLSSQTLLGWVFGILLAVQVITQVSGLSVKPVVTKQPLPSEPAIARAGVKPEINAPRYILPGMPVIVTVADRGRNINPDQDDTLQVTLLNNATKEKETVTLTEYGPNSGLFVGSLNTTFDKAKSKDNDGLLNVSEKQTLESKYNSDVIAKTIIAPDSGSAFEIGQYLFTKFVYPFEVVGLLLLIAVIGAVIIAKKKL
jgi:NADH:ubiquinone oxidoreductase subunit 6 (subunit J)